MIAPLIGLILYVIAFQGFCLYYFAYREPRESGVNSLHDERIQRVFTRLSRKAPVGDISCDLATYQQLAGEQITRINATRRRPLDYYRRAAIVMNYAQAAIGRPLRREEKAFILVEQYELKYGPGTDRRRLAKLSGRPYFGPARPQTRWERWLNGPDRFEAYRYLGRNYFLQSPGSEPAIRPLLFSWQNSDGWAHNHPVLAWFAGYGRVVEVDGVWHEVADGYRPEDWADHVRRLTGPALA